MKLLIVVCAAVFASCARSNVYVLVPRLDLGVRLARTRQASSLDDRTRVVLGAWLRWHPLITDPSAGSALSAAAAITPCEVGDDTCLTEFTEAEPEVAALRVGAP